MSLHVAMLSVHTSPLHQPGTGDAGGMNVYMLQLARALAERGAGVDLFTRCQGETDAAPVEVADGVRVRHLRAGPRTPLPKESLPDLLLDFALALVRTPGTRPYDVVHSHYWLSGQAGVLAARHWDVPLVHTMHTLAKVKNACLAPGDAPEPERRVHGESGVVRAADLLVANTGDEAEALVGMYGAERARTATVTPGVDTRVFHPGTGRRRARARLGLPDGAFVPMFAGRLQPLKGPDVIIGAVGEALRRDPGLRGRLLVPVVGGLSGTGTAAPGALEELCHRAGVRDVVRFVPAVSQEELADWYRAADVLVVPSRTESFGLVALEAQACGTPVLAAGVGGLTTAVRDGVTGLLVQGHDPRAYAERLLWFARRPGAVARMGPAAARHARERSWEAAGARTLGLYEDAAERARPAGGAGAAACPRPVGDPLLEQQGHRVPSLPSVLV